MKKIEIILIPIFMFSDYYLTILGNIYRTKKYGEHFITETYELNPQWRNDIDNYKWINYKHILIVLVMTGFFFLISQSGDNRSYESFMGFYLTIYGMIIGRHISNLFLFNFLISHPDEVSGKIYISHRLSLKISQYQILVYAIPILILTISNPNPFNIGGILSCLAFFIYHIIWLAKDKRKREESPRY